MMTRFQRTEGRQGVRGVGGAIDMASPLESMDLTPVAGTFSQSDYEDVQIYLKEMGLEFNFKSQQQLKAVKHYIQLQERKRAEANLWKEYLESLQKEYMEEGKRLDEQLSIIGVSQKDLDHKGATALKFVAQAAEILGSRGGTEEEMLLLWTDLVLEDLEYKEKQRRLSQSLAKSYKGTERANKVLSRLQSVLQGIGKQASENEKFKERSSEVREQAQADGLRAADEARALHEVLWKAGYDEKLEVEGILKQIEELREKKSKLRKAQEHRARYHDLPIDVEGARAMLGNAQQLYKELRTKLIEKMADVR